MSAVVKRSPSRPNNTMSEPRLSAILCADWSKSRRKREVYAADVERREVRRLAGTWTAAGVIEAARKAAGDGSALATFDAPIGVPISYWQKLRQISSFPDGVGSFPAWLPEALKTPRYFDNARSPWDWTRRPTSARLRSPPWTASWSASRPTRSTRCSSP